MDLLIVQLKASIRRLLDTKGVRGRVLDKVNRYGEVVIGVILERPAPPPLSTASPESRAPSASSTSTTIARHDDASQLEQGTQIAPDAAPGEDITT